MVRIKYEPEVSLEQIMAFDPERPETHTTSAFINAVCLSFAKNGYMNCKQMGESLGMSELRFSAAFEALTGQRYARVRPLLVERKAHQLRTLHPAWTTEQLAHALGFNGRGSLWAIIPEDGYKRLGRESKKSVIARLLREYEKTLK